MKEDYTSALSITIPTNQKEITTMATNNNSSAPDQDQIFGEDQHPEIQHHYGMTENARIFFMCFKICLYSIAGAGIGQLIYHLTN